MRQLRASRVGCVVKKLINWSKGNHNQEKETTGSPKRRPTSVDRTLFVLVGKTDWKKKLCAHMRTPFSPQKQITARNQPVSWGAKQARKLRALASQKVVPSSSFLFLQTRDLNANEETKPGVHATPQGLNYLHPNDTAELPAYVILTACPAPSLLSLFVEPTGRGSYTSTADGQGISLLTQSVRRGAQ